MKILIKILLLFFPVLLMAQESIVEFENVNIVATTDDNKTSFKFTDNKYSAIQFKFETFDLNDNSRLVIHQLETDYKLFLNSKTIEDYHYYSCFFSPGTFVFKIESAVDAENESVIVSELLKESVVGDKSICGTVDNRVASVNRRVGRTRPLGCTAYLLSNGALAMAGHCTGAYTFIEFDVPLSNANGSTNPSAPEDQFPFNTASLTNESNSCGRDWAIFTVGDNAITGNNVFLDRGSFMRPTDISPTAGSTIRITGYGVDPGNSANRTNQTHTGAYSGRWNNGASGIYYGYQADTEGANSGSPIIMNSDQNFSFGIHAQGGCNGGGCGGNSMNAGTSFQYAPLSSALDNFFNSNTIHVDKISNTSSETGTVFRPYDTFIEARNASSSTISENVIIVKGTYDEVNGTIFNKKMLVHAPVGTVIIK